MLSLQSCDSRKNPSLSILVSNGYIITGNALLESDSDVITSIVLSGIFFVSSLKRPNVRPLMFFGMIFSLFVSFDWCDWEGLNFRHNR